MRVVTRESTPNLDRVVTTVASWFPPRALSPAVPVERIERLGLAVTSLVALLGIALTYIGQTVAFDEIRREVTAGRIVNLAATPTATAVARVLTVFDTPSERDAAAAAIVRRAQAAEGTPFTHVGELAALRSPATGSANTMLFTPAAVTAIKPALIVRTPETYARRVGIAVALLLTCFWLAHLVRSAAGVAGDPVVLPILQLLTALGFSTMLALRDPLRDTIPAWPFASGVVAGLVAFTAIAFVDFEQPRLRRSVLVPLSGAALLALALLLFGSGPGGSGAKVNLMGVQPVEVIRLLVVFGLAAYFARRWQFLREFSETAGKPVFAPSALSPSRAALRWTSGRGKLAPRVRLRMPRWKDARPLAITIGVLFIFFLLQKDLGPALVMSCVFLGLYGVARARAALVLGGCALLTAGFAVGFLLGVPATVMRRVAMWLDPWENALAGGDQIAHALWALGTGAVWGVGPGMGDPQFIPAGYTDLVVAAIGEELGFVGLFVIVGLFALLVRRLLRIALHAPGDYTAFLAAGLCLAIAVQGVVIVGAIFGLLPLAGVVTPFLSYGRSSMVANFVAVGVCCAIARRAGPPREHFVRPFLTLGRTLAAAGAAILIAAGAVQVIAADSYASRGNLSRQADGGYRYQYNPRLMSAARQIVRGTIYDRSGLPLASSRPTELLPFADELRALGVTLPNGCGAERARCYPLGGMAFHVIGESDAQTNWAARNASFVERDLDARLKGFDDRPRTVLITDPDGRTRPVIARDFRDLLPLTRHRGNPAHPAVRRIVDRDRDVRLALDARLQMRVARALESHASSRSGRGAAIVLDAASGQLLALASYPWPVWDTEGDLPAAERESRLLDRARFGLYPPGSTFKIVTAAAAFRASAATQNSTFRCVRLDDGRVGGHVDGVSRPVRDDPLDHVPHGVVDLRRALVVSCNAYFAQLAHRVGSKGINETATAARINVARAPLEHNLPATLAHAGYGQGQVVASPLRMARVVAAVANGGILRDVKIALEPFEPDSTPVQWISARASRELARYMRDAVTEGTGRSLATHPGRIAGKTGTAEVDGAVSHSWFVGFAPYRGAGRKLAFAVVLENAGYGGRAAAALAGEIVRASGLSE